MDQAASGPVRAECSGNVELSVDNGKHGTAFTAGVLVVGAVGGVGALAVPQAVAWLGWIAGPLLILVFYAVTLASAHILRKLYMVDGIEFARYHHAVKYILGDRAATAVAVTQSVSCIMGTITYSLAGATALQVFMEGIGATALDHQWYWLILLGGVQLCLSQVPSLADCWWIGTAATILAACFCTLTLVMGCLSAGNGGGTLGGMPASPADKAFGVLSAMGTLAFAYSFCEIITEISDTLRQPPAATQTMKRAIDRGVSAAAAVYLAIGATCYAAQGNSATGQILDGFKNDPNVPTWLVLVSQFVVALQTQMVWQIWAQPVYDTIESLVKRRKIQRHLAAAAANPSAHGGSKKGDGLTEADKGGLGDEAAAGAGAAADLPGGSPTVVAAAAHHAVMLASPFATTLPEHHPLATLLESLPPPDAESGDVEALGGSPVTSGGLGGSAAMSGDALSTLRARRSACTSVLMRSRRMTEREGMPARQSGSGFVILNSTPIPDLLPPGWKPSKRLLEQLEALKAHLPPPPPLPPKPSFKPPPLLMRAGRSALATLSRVFDSRAVALHYATGAEDERVPLNDTGYLLPWWQRLALRSSIVVAVTLICIFVPFFSTLVSLIGALCYWPLTLYFPYAMYRKVYRPGRKTRLAMAVTEWGMLGVCVAAAIGACRQLIVGWGDVVFFA